MIPFVADPDFTLYVGDVREVLAGLSDESVHCCVTSPPYLGLRDYGMDGQIGLEGTLGEYVDELVAVFAEVRRVLRSDGTCWLNLGDSFNAYNGGAGPGSKLSKTQTEARPRLASGFGLQQKELKPKDLMGVPWRVALALQADGWWLRSDIIWAKPNPMPESVTDRPTKSHEYLFLLTKSARYFYDAPAIAEPATWYGPNGKPKSGPHAGQMQDRAAAKRPQQRRAAELAEQHGLTEAHFEAIRAVGISDTGKALTTTNGAGHSDPEKQRLANEAKAALGGYYREFLIPLTRNARSVWTIQTQQFADAHFAVFPEELPRRCIAAGTSEHGCCPVCGAPWERETEREPNPTKNSAGPSMVAIGPNGERDPRYRSHSGTIASPPGRTTGWKPTCDHGKTPAPCTVLDIFMGSGTTALVARRLGRKSIGVELNPQYAEMCARRLSQQSLLAGDAA